MNYFTWCLNEDDASGYLWRIVILLGCIFLFFDMPGMGKLLWYIFVFDLMYWFMVKKPSLKASE